MKLTINPGLTLNVGSTGTTGSSTITYEVEPECPSSPNLGDFRFIPQQVINSGEAAVIHWYDPDKKKWLVNTSTLFDLHLAHAIVQQTDYDPNNYVYYKLILNFNEAISLLDERKPSFAVDNVKKGE